MSTTPGVRPDAPSLVFGSFGEAWRRMVRLMFRGPAATFSNWLLWGLIILIAGVMGNVGGNFNVPTDEDVPYHKLRDLDVNIAVLISLVVVVVMLLVLVVLYFQSRFRLVFLEGVLAGEPRIRGVYGRTADPGARYWLFRLAAGALFLCALVAAALLWFPAVREIVRGGEPSVGVVVGLVLTVFVYVLPLAAALGIVTWFVHQLALPQLWLRGGSLRGATGRAWALTKENLGATLLLLVMWILTGVGAAIVYLVAVCCTCWAWGAPLAVIVGLVILTAAAPLAAVVTIPLIVLLALVMAWFMATLTAPIPVFFRAWSLSFVAGTDPDLAWLSAGPAAPTASGPPAHAQDPAPPAPDAAEPPWNAPRDDASPEWGPPQQ